MNGKQTESKGAGGAWAWVRRNDAILLVGGLVIAMMQYQTIQMAALVEQVSLRITSLERSQERIVEQLGLRITAVQENQYRAVEQLGARIASLEKSMERLAGQLGARMAGLETRMASLEGRMTTLEGRMTTLEGRMTTLDSRVTGLETGVAAIQRGRDRVAGQLGERITSLERDSESAAAALRDSQALTAARITELDEDAAELADGMNDRLGRIEDNLGLPPPEAPG